MVLKKISSKNKLLSIKSKLFPWRDRPKIQYKDAIAFKEISKVWQGASILRWYMTEWCNYDCPYCIQNHSRQRIVRGFKIHAFDNYPPKEWIAALRRNFIDVKLALTITGGEPMIDTVNMHAFLTELLPQNFVENVRIDTNLSWDPKIYADLPSKEKLIFMCSFQPMHTSAESFIERATSLMTNYKIGMVNYVMYEGQIEQYENLKEKFVAAGLPLHPNPLWYTQQPKESLEIMAKVLSPIDLHYRAGGNPKGKSCLYPSLAYEMNHCGDIIVGCFPILKGNIFSNRLPKKPDGPVKCASSKCTELDKYSFIKGVNRNMGLNCLEIYGNILRKNLGITSPER